MKQRYFFTTLMICVTVLNASEFPGGCKPMGYQFNKGYLLLNDLGKQTFFMIQNKSTTPVSILRVQTKDAFMSPKFESSISPYQWSAFASDSIHLPLACYSGDNQAGERIDCQAALDICEYPNVKFALSNMGTYWVSMNKSRQDIITDAVKTGIYLKW
jgi:hypothetical protein